MLGRLRLEQVEDEIVLRVSSENAKSASGCDRLGEDLQLEKLWETEI